MRIPVICASTVLALTTLSGTASAATLGTSSGGWAPNTVELCAFGNYRAEIQLPQQGTTVDVPQGSCSGEIHLGAGTTVANIYGFWNTHPDQKFWVGQVNNLRAISTVEISAGGATTSPTVTVARPVS
ncbi:hypothetical protein ACWGJX_40080 [Streptomyces sp. NPDC054775]